MGPRVSARLNPASLLVSGGMTLPMIGRLLGHTRVQTTQRYAHLFDDPRHLAVVAQPDAVNCETGLG
jgi:site-specific recombinase XerD